MRRKINQLFISFKSEHHQEDPQLPHLHQPTQKKVYLPLKLQEWEKTSQLNHMVIMKVPQPGVDITPVCTIMNQATNELIHTMIHLIKTSISETEPSCHQIETLEKWLLLRFHTPTIKLGPIQLTKMSQDKEVMHQQEDVYNIRPDD
jgi:hypothetical protein